LEGVERWLQEAERQAPLMDTAIQRENLLGNIAAIRTYVAVRKGDHIHVAELARQALQHLPESNPGIRSAVTATLGRAYWINGDLEAASCAFAEAARSGQAADNLYLASGSACSLADLLCELGRLNDAMETYQQALQLATLPDGHRLPLAGRAYAGLSKVFYEWNDLDAVTRLTDESIRLCQQFGSADSLSIAYGMLARLKQAQGDVEQARAAILQAMQLAREHDLWPVEASWVQALRVRLWLAQGDDLLAPDQALKTVAGWVQMGDLDIADQIAYPRQIEYLMVARMLLARGEHRLALTLSDRLIRQA